MILGKLVGRQFFNNWIFKKLRHFLKNCSFFGISEHFLEIFGNICWAIFLKHFWWTFGKIKFQKFLELSLDYGDRFLLLIFWEILWKVCDFLEILKDHFKRFLSQIYLRDFNVDWFETCGLFRIDIWNNHNLVSKLPISHRKYHAKIAHFV